MKFLILSLFFASSCLAEVICEKNSECPENVGQVVIYDSGYKVCTGFLVKEDVVATNLHCIPDNLQKVGMSCAKTIKVIFPGQKNIEADLNDCEKVLFLSAPLQKDSLNVDLALLKFKKSFAKKSFRISQEGFPFQAKYHIYKIDPDPKGGLLKKISCVPKPNTVLNPYFKSERSPIINLSPCAAVKGNSGSPILSDEGLVRGVLGSGGGLGTKESSADMNVVFGSNFSCVDLALLGYPSQNLSSCDIAVDAANEKKLAGQMYQKENDRLVKIIEEKLQFEKRFKNSDARIFQWNMLSAQRSAEKEATKNAQGEYLIRGILFQLQPKCILFKGMPLDIIRKKVIGGNIQLSFDLPEFEAQQKVGNQLEMAADVTEKNQRYKVKTSLVDFFNNSQIRFDVEKQDGSKQSWELSSCSE